MKELLAKLNRSVEHAPGRYFFNDPAPPELIDQVERKYDIRLPADFREFLQNCNGGFISLIQRPGNMAIDDIAWNSNYILAIELIDELFPVINQKTRGMEVRYIPMLHTAGGEYLGFMVPPAGEESAVYDLWHEAPAADWADAMVYGSFREFLEVYLRRNGDVETIG